EVQARRLKRVALLGTRFTVESRMFGRLGVDVIMPKASEIEQIHNTYMDALNDRSTPEQIDELRQLARTLISRDGADAVLIAGTDLDNRLRRRAYTGDSEKTSCLEGFASEQFRHFACEACRFADEHALEGRHSVTPAQHR